MQCYINAQSVSETLLRLHYFRLGWLKACRQKFRGNVNLKTNCECLWEMILLLQLHNNLTKLLCCHLTD